MSAPQPLLSSDDRDKVAALQWYAKSVMEGLNVGQHRSPHKGVSVEFKEHRPYVRGDEVRSIDWKLFGKTDRLYIRQFEEETNLRATLLVDQSGSMKYAGARRPGPSKHQFAIRLAASLAYLFTAQHDAVGLATFDTKLRAYLPARSRPSHLHELMVQLATAECGGETKLAPVVETLAGKISRRGVVFLISDGFDDASSLLRSLQRIRQAPNEIVFFQVWHPDELDFPFSTRTQFRSLENTSHERLVDPHAFRVQYQRNLQRFRSELEEGCKQSRISLVSCTTADSHVAVLAHFLQQRGAKS
ncbi:MAG: DUF58 domain-containing protein [Planctomycetaceae bacterium]|nr:DUF58 domain-containing protein [Planctomycetaceae bacterium]